MPGCYVPSMPRRARLVIAGVPHHVTQRGNRRGQVFFADADRCTYLAWLREYAEECSVDVLAYCLMSNHVHLVLVPASSTGLHAMIMPLHARYAQRINRMREWRKHLWQGRFHSSALDEAGLWSATRYVELNPVRAGMVARAEAYRWSSAGSHCGLALDPILAADSPWRRALPTAGDWSLWLNEGDDPDSLATLRRSTELDLPHGSQAFVERLEAMSGRPLRPRAQRRPRREVLLG